MTSMGMDCVMLVIPSRRDFCATTAHHWIRAVLGKLPEPGRLHATLIAQELVAVARDHGAPPYVLRFITFDRRTTLLVSIDMTIAEGHLRQDLGLVLVSGLSSHWGVERRRRACTVWAELAVDASGLTTPDQPQAVGDHKQ